MARKASQYRVDQPPEWPELHASRQKLHDILDPTYWSQLCPGLHVEQQACCSAVEPLQLPETRVEDVKQQVNCAGVAQLNPSELFWCVKPEMLAAAVVNLIRHGWPPSMLLAFDEVWLIIHQASVIMAATTGGNACNMDILAWYVDPANGDAGFSPHRDRQPDDSPATFRADGTPMYATLWLPLTHATPDNSCLYVIPRFADPGYFEGDPEDESAPDPLTAALPNKEAYQHIRALPAAPGSAVIFTHRTIHWGSKSRTGYPVPRISISWGCSDDAFEAPYFSRQHLRCPPLALRLALVGAQMIVYHERFPAPPKQLAVYYQAFKAQADQFDAVYRAKVMQEFVDASKEATANSLHVDSLPAVKAAASKTAASGSGQAMIKTTGANGACKSSRRRRKKAAACEAPAATGSGTTAAAAEKPAKAVVLEAATTGGRQTNNAGRVSKKRTKQIAGSNAATHQQQQQQRTVKQPFATEPQASEQQQQQQWEWPRQQQRQGVYQQQQEQGEQQQQPQPPHQQNGRQAKKRRCGKNHSSLRDALAAAAAQMGTDGTSSKSASSKPKLWCQQQVEEQPMQQQGPKQKSEQIQSSKTDERDRDQLKQQNRSAINVAGTAEVFSDSSEGGSHGIDWAELAAQAKPKQKRPAAACKGKRTGRSKPTKGKGSANEPANNDNDDARHGSENDDVLDLALESILDAQLAGQDAEFHDDYAD